MEATPPFVTLSDVSIKRGARRIVDGISFSLPSRGLVLLGGENGAGKTTLLLAMAGLRTPERGTIVIDGHDLSTASGRRAIGGKVVYLPQSPSCPRSFTVLDLMLYSAWLQRVAPAERAGRAMRSLERVNLVEKSTTRVTRLSGGEQRRAFVASTMVGDASLILLDEPTVGLDAAQRVAVRRILSELAHESTVFVSSHIAEDFEHLAERILLLDHGRILFDDTRAAFVARGSTHPADISQAEALFTAILSPEVPE